jgi:hypothetical protein
MKYFLDTEFHEDGRTIDLISIGIAAEDGREYYAISEDFNRTYAYGHAWLRENVLPSLPWDGKLSRLVPDISTGLWKSRPEIAEDIRAFCDPEKYGKPEIWAYYADYDWVALCQLFGTMMDLPKGWPMYCRDIKQLTVMLGNPKLPKQEDGEHHALADARWNRQAWEFLQGRGNVVGSRAGHIGEQR